MALLIVFLILIVPGIVVGIQFAGQRALNNRVARSEKLSKEIQNKLVQTFRERLESTGVNDVVLAEALRQFKQELSVLAQRIQQSPTPEPAPNPFPTPSRPRPGGGTQQPTNPAPSEPMGGEEGSLKPFVCAQGLQGFLGIDCSPGSPMASTQIMCNAGFDDVFTMDCGNRDEDGREK